MLWVDRMPRHWFISFGLGACAILMAIEAALQRFYLGTDSRGGLIASATVIFLFQATFCAFLDGPTYFYIAEIWPSYARSQGMALAMSTFALTNLTWLQAAPYAFKAIGWKFYTIFIVVPAIAAVIIFFTYHDTRYKPLEEIAALFGDANQVVMYQHELGAKDIRLDDMEVEARKSDTGIEQVEDASREA
jgi:MFS family permease